MKRQKIGLSIARLYLKILGTTVQSVASLFIELNDDSLPDNQFTSISSTNNQALLPAPRIPSGIMPRFLAITFI